MLWGSPRGSELGSPGRRHEAVDLQPLRLRGSAVHDWTNQSRRGSKATIIARILKMSSLESLSKQKSFSMIPEWPKSVLCIPKAGRGEEPPQKRVIQRTPIASGKLRARSPKTPDRPLTRKGSELEVPGATFTLHNKRQSTPCKLKESRRSDTNV